MLDQNKTPFAAIAFEQFHRDGDQMAVIAVRGSFVLTPRDEKWASTAQESKHPPLQHYSLTIADRQAMVLADEYDGQRERAALIKSTDLVPFKPATDITVIGHSFAPNGSACDWPFEIRVAGSSHRLRCRGERSWECDAGDRRRAYISAAAERISSPRWRMSEPRPIASIPLEYAYAAGGEIIGAPEYEVDHRNPLGRGVIHRSYIPGERQIFVPEIESDDHAVREAFDAPEPQGTAPIPPEWLWRRRYAGTYDEVWKQDRAPYLPHDFNYRFYQCAHPALIWDGYLGGDEPIELLNLAKDIPHLGFHLPGVQPIAKFEWLDERVVVARLNLDGVHIDMRDESSWTVDLTWRAWIVICPQFFKIDLKLVKLDRDALSDLPVSGETGLEEAITSLLRLSL